LLTPQWRVFTCLAVACIWESNFLFISTRHDTLWSAPFALRMAIGSLFCCW